MIGVMGLFGGITAAAEPSQLEERWTAHEVGALQVAFPLTSQETVERRTHESATLLGAVVSDTWVVKTPSVWFAVTKVELPAALRAIAPTSAVLRRAQNEILGDSEAVLTQSLTRPSDGPTGRRLWFRAHKEPEYVVGLSDIYVHQGTLFTLTVVRGPSVPEATAMQFLDSARWPAP